MQDDKNELDRKEIEKIWATVSKDSLKAAVDKFFKYYPLDSHVLSQVVTGHILIEQEIASIYKQMLVNPEALESNNAPRYNCNHYIYLIKSNIDPNHSFNYLFDSILMLNEIRNKIAHNLINDSHIAKLKNFVELVKEIDNKTTDYVDFETCSSELINIKHATNIEITASLLKLH